jgi:hypothetical protein
MDDLLTYDLNQLPSRSPDSRYLDLGQARGA